MKKFTGQAPRINLEKPASDKPADKTTDKHKSQAKAMKPEKSQNTPHKLVNPDKASKSTQKLVVWLGLGLLGVALLTLAGIVLWFFVTISALRPDAPVNGEVVEVKSGEGLEEIAANLADKGLINNSWAFVIYARLGPAHGQLKSGAYLVRPSSSILSIVSDMAAGKIAVNTITYPEGITLADMATRYASAGYGNKASYEAASKSVAREFDFIPATLKDNPEGYLFPATYTFNTNAAADALVRKQFQAFADQIQPLLQAKRPGGLSPVQVLTLASIVEKEGLTMADRKLIAGVFLNRLALGMKLESDVTVNYATGKKTTSPADLSIVSPYNTYKVAALPPGPINNPSKDAVEATMNPTVSDNLFFLAGNDGTVYYAKTLQEHNVNIKNHL